VAEEIARVTEVLTRAGASNISVSQSEAERLRFWAGRKAAFPAVGRITPDYYCMDGTIPRKRLAEMLAAIAASGQGSFLAVLKNFGDKPSPGLLSFPMAGTTLALDFPNRGAPTLALFERLDAIVRAAGGRLYPAKDARMPAAMFRAGYPRLAEFTPCVDPKFSSGFWRRVMEQN